MSKEKMDKEKMDKERMITIDIVPPYIGSAFIGWFNLNFPSGGLWSDVISRIRESGICIRDIGVLAYILPHLGGGDTLDRRLSAIDKDDVITYATIVANYPNATLEERKALLHPTAHYLLVRPEIQRSIPKDNCPECGATMSVIVDSDTQFYRYCVNSACDFKCTDNIDIPADINVFKPSVPLDENEKLITIDIVSEFEPCAELLDWFELEFPNGGLWSDVISRLRASKLSGAYVLNMAKYLPILGSNDTIFRRLSAVHRADFISSIEIVAYSPVIDSISKRKAMLHPQCHSIVDTAEFERNIDKAKCPKCGEFMVPVATSSEYYYLCGNRSCDFWDTESILRS